MTFKNEWKNIRKTNVEINFYLKNVLFQSSYLLFQSLIGQFLLSFDSLLCLAPLFLFPFFSIGFQLPFMLPLIFFHSIFFVCFVVRVFSSSLQLLSFLHCYLHIFPVYIRIQKQNRNYSKKAWFSCMSTFLFGIENNWLAMPRDYRHLDIFCSDSEVWCSGSCQQLLRLFTLHFWSQTYVAQGSVV